MRFIICFSFWAIIPLFGGSYPIPHIAGANWSTSIQISNQEHSSQSILLSKWDGQGQLIIQVAYSVPASGNLTLTNSDLLYDGVALIDTPPNSSMQIKLSYRFGQSQSLCEFFIGETKETTYLLPNPIYDHFAWFGMALANFNDESIDVLLTAYKDGQQVGTTELLIPAHQKIVNVSSVFFSDVNYEDVDLVTITSVNQMPVPLSITGDSGQTRHVFFKAQALENITGAYRHAFIPHVAASGWKTAVTVTNPTAKEESFHLKSWAEDGSIDNPGTSYSVQAHRSLELSVGAYPAEAFSYGCTMSAMVPDSMATKLSYQFGQSESICEFFLSDKAHHEWIIPNSIFEWFTWFGISVANPYDEPLDVLFEAHKGGELIAEEGCFLEAHTKFVALSTDIWPEGIPYTAVDSIIIRSNRPIPAPISITGNDAQDRHVYFQGETVREQRNWNMIWESMNGPPGGATSFLEIDPFQASTLYAGTGRGLYKSTNNGYLYRLLAGTNSRVSSVAFTQGAIFFAMNQNVFRLDRTTEQVESVLNQGDRVFSSNGLLFAMVGSESLRQPAIQIHSAAAGNNPLSWTDISPSTEELSPLLAPYLDPSGVVSGWVGATNVISTGDRLLACIAVAGGPIEGNIASTAIEDVIFDDRLLASSDNGATWQEIDLGLPEDLVIYKMVPDRVDPRHVLITCRYRGHDSSAILQPLNEFLYKTHDGGQTWQQITQITEIKTTFVGDIDIVGSDYYLTHVEFEIIRLIGPDYTTFERFNMPQVEGYSQHMTIQDLIFDPSDSNTVFGRNYGQGLIRSDDFMESWSLQVDGIVVPKVANVTVHPHEPNIIFTSNNQNFAPYRTINFGESWSILAGLSSFSDELAVDPFFFDHIIIGDEITTLQESFDLGDTWTVIAPNFSANRIFDFELTTGENAVLYASNIGTGVSRFADLNNFEFIRDHGELPFSWETLPNSSDYAYDIEIDPNDSDVLYATYSPKIFETSASLWKFDQNTTSENKWTKLLDVEGAAGMTSIEIDPSSSDTLYVGVTGPKGLIYTSRDHGQTWATKNDKFTFVTIHELTMDPNDENTVYAAPWGGGMFRSTNSGDSWTEIKTPTPSISSILVDATESSHLMIGDRTSPSVFQSPDAGRTWSTLVSLDENSHYRIFAMAHHNGKLFLSVLNRFNGLIALLLNGPLSGSTFRMDQSTPVELGGDLSRAVLQFFSHSSGLYAVTHIRGVFRLEGDNWVDISGNLPDMGFNSIVVDINDNIYVSGGCDLDLFLNHRVGDVTQVNEIYRSTDGGTTWTRLLNTNPFNAPVKMLLPHPQDSSVLYAATDAGLFQTTDAGSTWMPQNTGLDYKHIGDMAVGATRIYAGTLGGGVYSGTIKEDRSITWNDTMGPFPKIFHIQIRVDPSNSNTVYATAYPGGVFKSTDRGTHWIECNFGLPSFAVKDPVTQGYYSLEIDPNTPDTLYLGIFSKGLYRSLNGAATWIPLYGTNGQNAEIMRKGITRIVIDPADSQRLYLGTHEGMYRSIDSGQSWTTMNTGLDSLDILSVKVADDSTVYVGTGGYDMYVFNSTGNTWEHMGRTTGFGQWTPWERKLYQYLALLFDPHVPDRIYLGHFPGGFYISEDGGQSFVDSSLGLGNDGMFSLVTHPSEVNTIYGGTYNGVVKSVDGGSSWIQKTNGMPSELWPFTVAIDPFSPNIMYISSKNGQNAGFCERNTFCGMVMKSLDAGESWFKTMNGLSDQYEYYGLIIHPENPDLIFISSNKGVFASQNGGHTWQPIDSSLPTTENQMRDNVAQNLQITMDLQHLILGINDYGVFSTNIGNLSKK